MAVRAVVMEAAMAPDAKAAAARAVAMAVAAAAVAMAGKGAAGWGCRAVVAWCENCLRLVTLR